MIGMMHALHWLVRLAAVVALGEAHVGAINDVGVLRIDVHRREIPGPLAQIASAVDERPLDAAVVGAIKAAVLGFDERVDALAVRRRDGDADAAKGLSG